MWRGNLIWGKEGMLIDLYEGCWCVIGEDMNEVRDDLVGLNGLNGLMIVLWEDFNGGC